MYPWISRTFDFWLQFFEKMCGLYMDVYGIIEEPVLPDDLADELKQPITRETKANPYIC